MSAYKDLQPFTVGTVNNLPIKINENGVPKELSGIDFIMTIHTDENDSEAIIQVQATHIDEYTVAFVFEPADTEALDTGLYYYRINMIVELKPYRILEGLVRFKL